MLKALRSKDVSQSQHRLRSDETASQRQRCSNLSVIETGAKDRQNLYSVYYVKN